MSQSPVRLQLIYSPHDHLLAEEYLSELEESGVEYDVLLQLGEELHVLFDGLKYWPISAEVGNKDDGIILAIRAARHELVPKSAAEMEAQRKLSAGMILSWDKRRATASAQLDNAPALG